MSNSDSTTGLVSSPAAIRGASAADLPAIAKVHLAAFDARFTLSALGSRFLRKYYNQVLQFDDGLLLVAEVDGRIAGFVAGFLNPKRFYKTLMRHKWQFAILAIKAVPRNPFLLRRLWGLVHRVLFPLERVTSTTENSCELSSLAVHPSVAGRGVGKALVMAFVDLARQKGASSVTLTTDAMHNNAVNAFYQQLNFQVSRTFLPPGGRLLNEYVCDLRAGGADAVPASDAPT